MGRVSMPSEPRRAGPGRVGSDQEVSENFTGRVRSDQETFEHYQSGLATTLTRLAPRGR